MIKLNKETVEWAMDSITRARDLHIECNIVIQTPEMMENAIVLYSSDTMDEIKNKLNSSYIEAPLVRNEYDKVMLDEIFSWGRSFHADINGWVCLFTDDLREEDCRWYLKVEDENSIYLYRKERSFSKEPLKKICRFRRIHHGPYTDTENTICCTSFVESCASSEFNVHRVPATLGEVSDDIDKCLGTYAMLVKEVIYDIIMCIRNKRMM